MEIEKLINVYENEYSKYLSFSNRIYQLIIELFTDVKYHAINCRVKTKDSLEKKIIVKNKYENILEITDIIGLRIITYLTSEVDFIEDIIKRNFRIDTRNSIDKRKKDATEFGYKSLHLICYLDEKRSELPEYNIYKNIPFEVQIRTILQHSWAEIEHDLGYKNDIQIPTEYRRSLYRLSSLLEIADDEFEKITINVNNYRKELNKNKSKLLRKSELNKDSLIAFMNNDKLYIELLEDLKVKYKNMINEPTSVDLILERLNYLDIKYIEYLSEKLNKYKLELIPFFYKLTEQVIIRGRFSNNILIFYLIYLILYKECSNEAKIKFFNEFSIDKTLLEKINIVGDELSMINEKYV